MLERCCMGECVVFSTKKRLIHTYKTRFSLDFSLHFTFDNIYECVFFNGGVRIQMAEPFICIYGINDMIITEAKQKLNNILEKNGGMNGMIELLDDRAFHDLGWEAMQISVSPPFSKERLLYALQKARRPGYELYYHFVNENTVLYVARHQQ